MRKSKERGLFNIFSNNFGGDFAKGHPGCKRLAKFWHCDAVKFKVSRETRDQLTPFLGGLIETAGVLCFVSITVIKG